MGDADKTAALGSDDDDTIDGVDRRDAKPPTRSNELDTIDGVNQRDASRPPTLPPLSPAAPSDYPQLVTVDRAHYRRGKEIGGGGMGRVIEARDLRLGRDVAIKELRPESRDAESRFEREARITARLQHPAIINIYEAGRWAGSEPFYAMTKVAGRSLDKVVKELDTLDERLSLLPNVIAVADALAYAHNANVIHRDLKPANVLVGEFGETVVIDWGLAKDLAKVEPELEAENKTTHSLQMQLKQIEETNDGSVLGTPAYMPPEQAQGRRDVINRRADVYSLGALLYHVLVGAAPYTKDTPISSLRSVPKRNAQEILELVRTKPCPSVRTLEPTAPPALVAIVAKAMERDAALRYADADEFSNELKRFQTGQLVHAFHYTLPRRVARVVRKHALVISVVSVALLALVIVGVVSIKRIVEEKETAELRRQTLLEERGRIELRDGQAGRAMAYLMGAAEDGKVGDARGLLIADALRPFEAERSRIPSSGSEGSSVFGPGGEVLVLRNGKIVSGHAEFGTGKATRLLTAGNRLITIEKDATVRVWSNGALERELRHTSDILDGHVSKDGRLLVTGTADGAWVWDLASGEEIVPTGWNMCEGGTRVTLVRFAPDAKSVVSAAGETMCYWTVDPTPPRDPRDPDNDNEARALRAHHGQINSIRWSSDSKYIVTAGIDGTARVWDPRTSKPAIAPLIHDGTPITSAEFSTRGYQILTAGADHTARLWELPDHLREDDPRRAREVRKLVGHGAGLGTAVFDSTSARVATAGSDNKAKVWDVASGEVMATFEHADVVTSVEFAPDGKRLLTASNDRSTRLWDLEAGVEATKPYEVESQINGVAVSRSGEVTAVRSDSLVTVWNPAGERQDLREHGGRVLAVAYSPNGDWLATAGEDSSAIIWNARTRAKQGTTQVTAPADTPPDAPPQSIYSLAFTPDSKQLATAGEEGKVRIWSVPDGALVRTLEFDTVLRQITFSPDGMLLAGVGQDGGTVVWTFATGAKLEQTLTNGRTRAIAFSNNGKELVASGTETRIWSLIMPGLLVPKLTVDGPTGEVAAVAFTHDDSVVITAGVDGIVRLWDANKGKLLSTRGAGGPSLNALAVSDNGRTIWVGGRDRLVRGWDVHIESRSVSDLASVIRLIPWLLDDNDNVLKTGATDGKH